MKRLLKWVLALVVLAVVVVAGMRVLLPLVFDTEDLKRTLADKVRKDTGRDFSIEGELAFSVFPNVAVRAEGVTLGNAAGFGSEPMAQIGEVRAGVALMPLLRREVNVDTVTLKGLDLRLQVDRNGNANWGSFGAGAGAEDAEGAAAPRSQTIAGVNIVDGRIEYSDARTGVRHVLHDVDLETGALDLGAPVRFELDFDWEAGDTASPTPVSLAANALLQQDPARLQLRDARLSLGEIVTESPEVAIDLGGETLAMERFSARMDGLEAEGSLQARDIFGDLRLSGSVKTGEFSPAAVLAQLGMEPLATADPNVLTRAQLDASFSGNLDAVTLQPLVMRLDDSRLEGRLDVADLATGKLRFDLGIDRLDADRYLPPSEAAAAGEGPAPVAIPDEELAGLDLRGNLRIGELRLMGLDLSEAQATLQVANDRLRLHPVSAKLFGGTYAGDVRIDASGARPSLSMDETVQAIDFGQAATRMFGRDRLSGTASGRVQLSGSGRTTAEVLDTLRGSVRLDLDDGALEGVNLWYEIRRALALYRQQPAPEKAEPRTVFSSLGLGGEVTDGVLRLDRLAGDLPFLTLRGGGAIDLKQQSLDLDLRATVRSAPELSADPLAADLQGKSLPLSIGGGLAAPKVGVDFTDLLKDRARERLLEKLGGGRDEEGEEGEEASSEDKASSLLKGLLDRKKKKEGDGG